MVRVSSISFIGSRRRRLYFPTSRQSLERCGHSQLSACRQSGCSSGSRLTRRRHRTLVWSSRRSRPCTAAQHYVDLMGGRSLICWSRPVMKGAASAETRVHYAPKSNQVPSHRTSMPNPWIRLFRSGALVERVETRSSVAIALSVDTHTITNFFDGTEREFRGFCGRAVGHGGVAALNAIRFSAATNIDAGSPVATACLYQKLAVSIPAHTDREHISNYFYRLLNRHDQGQYYRSEPKRGEMMIWSKRSGYRGTIFALRLTAEEEKNAKKRARPIKARCCARKYMHARRRRWHQHPYTVMTELYHPAPHGPLPKATVAGVLHTLEKRSYHYERNPDPRISTH